MLLLHMAAINNFSYYKSVLHQCGSDRPLGSVKCLSVQWARIELYACGTVPSRSQSRPLASTLDEMMSMRCILAVGARAPSSKQSSMPANMRVV